MLQPLSAEKHSDTMVLTILLVLLVLVVLRTFFWTGCSFVSRIYHVLLAHNKRILELLPINLIGPFVLSYKTRCTRQFEEEIYWYYVEMVSFFSNYVSK